MSLLVGLLVGFQESGLKNSEFWVTEFSNSGLQSSRQEFWDTTVQDSDRFWWVLVAPGGFSRSSGLQPLSSGLQA